MDRVNKLLFRKHLAGKSFSEKIEMLERLRRRGLAIRKAREKLRAKRETEKSQE
jgi:hypothetical protein